jgi:TRAP-type uncharacterized transport system fused permease subunit
MTHDPNQVVSSEAELTQAEIDEMIREFDSESNFRQTVGPIAFLITVLSVTLSLFHLYTAGFGLLNEVMHRTGRFRENAIFCQSR